MRQTQTCRTRPLVVKWTVAMTVAFGVLSVLLVFWTLGGGTFISDITGMSESVGNTIFFVIVGCWILASFAGSIGRLYIRYFRR
jgi:hypothetical protein